MVRTNQTIPIAVVLSGDCFVAPLLAITMTYPRTHASLRA